MFFIVTIAHDNTWMCLAIKPPNMQWIIYYIRYRIPAFLEVSVPITLSETNRWLSGRLPWLRWNYTCRFYSLWTDSAYYFNITYRHIVDKSLFETEPKIFYTLVHYLLKTLLKLHRFPPVSGLYSWCSCLIGLAHAYQDSRVRVDLFTEMKCHLCNIFRLKNL